jgi:WD40 repeat protein/anti-sigma factor RsiW
MGSGTDCVSEYDLRAYLLGDLNEARAETVAEHLSSCTDCDAQAGRLEGLEDAVLRSLRRALAPSPEPVVLTARPGQDATVDEVRLHPRSGPGLLPRHIGDYEVLEEIERGGMGVVCRARQITANRLVALKMILSGHLASPGDVERFLLEAEAAALMDHPGIVPIYDVGVYAGLPYFSMKLIEGGSLAKHQKRFRAPRDAARVMAQVARAVHYAHQRGILHRDLKPGNILLGENGEPLVSDFGLAKRMACIGDATSPVCKREEMVGLTQPGDIVGTPEYMSPEQASGLTHVLTTASDVYALGAILFAVLTGRPPFAAGHVLDTLWKVRLEPPPSPRSLNSAVNRDLETICLKCLQKIPTQRYPTAAELADDLESYLEGRPISGRPVGTFERAVMWARRRPAVAGLLAVASMALTTIVLLAVGYLVSAARLKETMARKAETEEMYQREAAEHQQAVEARADADRQRQRAESFLYANRIMRAFYSLSANDVARADEFLDECAPDQRLWEWWHVKHLCHAESCKFAGHKGSVSSVSLSADGTRLATGSYDRTIKIWDVPNGKLLHNRTSHAGPVLCVRFSADGTRLASGSRDNTIKVWHARNGKELFTLKGHGGWVWSLSFTADGKRLASGSADGTIRIWDLAKQEQLPSFGSGKIDSRGLSFCTDGRLLASGGDDGVVKLRDVEKKTEPISFTGHPCRVWSVSLSADGHYLASGDDKGTIKVWDARTGEEVRSFAAHAKSVTSVSLSADGKRLASGSEDKTVKVWDVLGRKEPLCYKGHVGSVNSVSLSADGKLLASGSTDWTARVWDATRAQEFVALEGHTSDVRSVSTSANGKLLASGSADGTVRVWEVPSRKVLHVLRVPGSDVTSVSLSADGERLASAGEDGTIMVWDARNGKEIQSRLGHEGFVWSVAFSADGKRLASAGKDRKVRIWDAAAGTVILTLQHSDDVNSVSLSADGKHVASGGFDGTVRFWDVHAGKELLSPEGDTHAVSVCFSADSKRLAFWSGSAIKLWDVEKRQVLRTLKERTSTVKCVAFSPDGKRLASGSHDGTIKVWDTETGLELLSFKGHSNVVNSVSFGADGGYLASGSADSTVKVWEGGRLE